MAKVETIIVTDDLDGSPGAETIEFELDGVAFTIDLTQVHADKLRAAVGPFIESGRRISNGRVTRPTKRVAPVDSPIADRDKRNKAIRAWAERKGIQIKPRGRISQGVIKEYDADQAKTPAENHRGRRGRRP